MQNTAVNNVCPFCRNAFTNRDVRAIRAEFGGAPSTREPGAGTRAGATRGGVARELNPTEPREQVFGGEELHEATCDVCQQKIRGMRYVSTRGSWHACL
jgi:hypothetical protein